MIEESDEEAPKILRRVKLNSLAAYFLFAILIVFRSGFSGLIGLTCSAAVTMISFLWLEEIVGALLQPPPQLRPKGLTFRAVARFVLLGVALLVTIFVARFDALSVLLGFSIVVVGIIGEAVYTGYRSFAS